MYDQKLSFFRRSKASRRIYGFFPDVSPFFVAVKTVGKLGGQNWKFKKGSCKFSDDFSFLMSLEVNHQNSKCKQSFSQICIFVQCHLVWKLLKQSHFTTFCPKSSFFFCLWDFLNKFQTLCTVFENHSKNRSWILVFSPIFGTLRLICLVILLDRKLQVLKYILALLMHFCVVKM